MPTAQEQAAGDKAEVLAEHLLEALDGVDTALAVVALIHAMGDVAEQMPESLRPVITTHLRQMADQIDALDATKH
jgi:predicted HD phosphohydrolase